ncbi:hypothetical protein B0H17DRAFT_1126862 [Mycena rosella]|uniref:Uncharacterized protein n=1 Tax=Mycena rosella TaxID=1033263 RepID=A0AAD7GSZ1_MYCRO|nr:hypothetical protein B0H17DRAFT_1126862 [Mycena rosella]
MSNSNPMRRLPWIWCTLVLAESVADTLWSTSVLAATGMTDIKSVDRGPACRWKKNAIRQIALEQILVNSRHLYSHIMVQCVANIMVQCVALSTLILDVRRGMLDIDVRYAIVSVVAATILYCSGNQII